MSRSRKKNKTIESVDMILHAPNPEVMDMLLRGNRIFRDKRDRKAKEHKNDWKKEIDE